MNTVFFEGILNMHPWFLLSLSILFELAGTVLLRLSDGYEKIWFTLGSVLCYCFSFYFLGFTLKVIPAGVAYAIWSGVGIIVISAISMIWLGEESSLLKWLFISFILTGVVGLHMLTEIKGA